MRAAVDLVVEDLRQRGKLLIIGRDGRIAKKARLELESKTGKSVISSGNYLPPGKKQKQLKHKPDNGEEAE